MYHSVICIYLFYMSNMFLTEKLVTLIPGMYHEYFDKVLLYNNIYMAYV